MDLVKKNINLPQNINELTKYILFTEEKFKNISQQIKSIEKLELGKDVYEKKLSEAQQVGSQVLDAKVKMGELLSNIQKVPKVEPSGEGSLRGSQKTLPEGINKKQSHQYQELFRNIEIVEQEKAEAIEHEDIPTTRNVLKKIKIKKREEKHEEKKQNIKISMRYKTLDEINKTYDVIYADPAWSYSDKGETKQIEGYGTASGKYIVSGLEEIKNMDVKKLRKNNTILFLWVTSPYLEMSFEIIKEWGFKYKSSFVWNKIKHNMGFYNSVRHEFLLICTHGNITPWNKKLFNSVYSEERTEHSKKPEYFYTVIETLYPNADYIELFSRNVRSNWDSWGNEID